MSRAYRIKVRESLNRVIRASDHVSTQLELLEILPAEVMSELLKQELENLGFEQDEESGQMTRTDDGVVVTVDTTTGTVTVAAEADQAVALETEEEGNYYDDYGDGKKKTREKLEKQAKDKLEQEARAKTEQLQKEVTDKLEGHLGDIQKELTKAVNKVTADALKQKAAQLGQIKEMTEDPESGNMTIVVEV